MRRSLLSLAEAQPPGEAIQIIFEEQHNASGTASAKSASKLSLGRFGRQPDRTNADDTIRYRASKADCNACARKAHCCPHTPARKIPRSINEGPRDLAREITKTDAYVVSRRIIPSSPT